jgi:hypothetical protein
MKNILKFLFIIGMYTVMFSSCATPSNVVVREKPAEPVFVRPAEPYRGAIFIPGEWVWRGRQYVYVQPHYVKPHRGRVWVPGQWTSARNGYVWQKGHWR